MTGLTFVHAIVRLIDAIVMLIALGIICKLIKKK